MSTSETFSDSSEPVRSGIYEEKLAPYVKNNKLDRPGRSTELAKFDIGTTLDPERKIKAKDRQEFIEAEWSALTPEEQRQAEENATEWRLQEERGRIAASERLKEETGHELDGEHAAELARRIIMTAHYAPDPLFFGYVREDQTKNYSTKLIDTHDYPSLSFWAKLAGENPQVQRDIFRFIFSQGGMGEIKSKIGQKSTKEKEKLIGRTSRLSSIEREL